MSLCPFCGAPLSEDARFCPRCGANVAERTPPAPIRNEPVPASPLDAKDSAAFKALRMHLHQESKAWRFGAIGVLVVMMGIAGLVLSLGLPLHSFFYTIDNADGPTVGTVVYSLSLLYSVFITLMLLPIVIMGFVMGSKVLRYYNQAETDCTNAVKHAGSVGVIVLAAIFSTPALVFVIINFVKTKRNRAELEAVQAWQRARGVLPRHE